MALEVEARFRADPESLARLANADRLGTARLGPPRSVDELDRYLDTDDGRLSAARWACRLRSREGTTRISLKGPEIDADGAAWLHRRPEVEGPAAADLDPATWPASAARDRLDGLRAGRPLRELFRLAQRRTEREVVVDGRRLGLLTLDAVRVVGPDGSDRGTLEIAEVELPATADAAAEALLAGLAGALDAAGLTPEPMTKLELALERIRDR
jgi:inorganic triphosphatase YgiF